MPSNKLTPDELLGRQPSTVWLIVATIGLLLVAAGTLMPILNVYGAASGHVFFWFRYVYAAGAVMFLVAKLFTPYTGKHQRIRRLSRIETWSGVFFCVAAFFLFYDQGETRDWLAFTLAGGAILIFTSIAVPITAKKELKK